MLALVKPKPKLLDSMAFFADKGHSCVGIAPIDIVEDNEGIAKLKEALYHTPSILNSVIVTSTEAASRLCSLLQEMSITGTTAVAIGQATARILVPFFTYVLSPNIQTSEGLIDEFSNQLSSAQTVLIVKGIGGRTVIEQALGIKGIAVEVAEIYRRKPLAEPFMPAHIDWSKVNVIAVTSGELLEALLTMVCPSLLLTKQWIVPSERVMDKAKRLGCKEVMCSYGASNHHLLGCVEKL